MNDKQYDAKHPRETSPRARLLADSEITTALYSCRKTGETLYKASAALAWSTGSVELSEAYNVPFLITDERKALHSFRDAMYSLLFVCEPLFPHASDGVLLQVDSVSRGVYALTNNLHIENSHL